MKNNIQSISRCFHPHASALSAVKTSLSKCHSNQPPSFPECLPFLAFCVPRLRDPFRLQIGWPLPFSIFQFPSSNFHLPSDPRHQSLPVKTPTAPEFPT